MEQKRQRNIALTFTSRDRRLVDGDVSPSSRSPWCVFGGSLQL